MTKIVRLIEVAGPYAGTAVFLNVEQVVSIYRAESGDFSIVTSAGGSDVFGHFSVSEPEGRLVLAEMGYDGEV
jgi:hypothetical protein